MGQLFRALQVLVWHMNFNPLQLHRASMKPVLLSFALLLASLPALSLAAVRIADRPSPYAHLEYFGFYASAMGHWNFTRELAPFTNLTWIHVGTAEQPEQAAAEFVARTREARQAGVRAVLSVEPFLFANSKGYPRSDEAIENWLIELRARLEKEGLLDTVAMIYPQDEPVREFRRARKRPASNP